MRIFFLLIIFFISCGGSKRISHSNSQELSFFPLMINNISASFIDTSYTFDRYRTGVYPPRSRKIVDGFNYNITIIISVEEKYQIWSYPFIVNVDHSSGYTNDIYLNEEGQYLIYGDFYNYTFKIKVQAQSKLRISLGYQDENNEIFIDKEDPFRSRIISILP